MNSHSRYLREAAAVALATAVAIPGIALAAGSARSGKGTPAHAAAGGCHVTQSHSLAGKPTKITFVNNDRSTVGVYWLDYSGALRFYETIPSKKSVVQHTYTKSAWAMLNPAISCVGYVIVNGQSKYVIH